MFHFAEPRARRRPGLTPLIDVVFLLLVFFMLASQFGRDIAIPLNTNGAGIEEYSGPPRLITIAADQILLNGQVTPMAVLIEEIDALVETRSDPVIVQPLIGVDLQRLTDVITLFSEAGFTGLILSEGTE